MEPVTQPTRIAERKQRDKQARAAQIVSAARSIAEAEGWQAVTVRRLSDEISYSQPVLYAHFGSREGILVAVALQGFSELGAAMEKARTAPGRRSPLESLAHAYLDFAGAFPALYEAMFSLGLQVKFDDTSTPPELRFAFAQLQALFESSGRKAEVYAELFWSSLHGTAELTRTKRFKPARHDERVKTLVKLFTPSEP